MIRRVASPRVTFGDVVYGPRGSCGPRVQRDLQIVGLVSGDACVQVDHREVRLAPGQMGLFLPGRRELFRFSTSRKTQHTWCAISSSLLTKETMTEAHEAVAVLTMTRRWESLVALALSTPNTLAAQGLIESLGLSALHEYLFASQRDERHEHDPPDALQRAVELIAQTSAEPVTLASLAGAAGVSPGQLVKLFKRHLHTTPMRYVWETRTRHGAQLLRETGLTVSEIAYRCGFQTSFHFSRLIRRHFHQAPRELRAQAWEG